MRVHLYTILLIFLTAVNIYSQVNVSISDTSVSETGKISIPVYVSNLNNDYIRSFQFHLTYDKSVLDFKSINERGTLTDIRYWGVDADEDKSGVYVYGSGWTSLSGDGVLIYLVFNILVENGKTDLVFDKFRFNNYNYPQAIINNGSFSIDVKQEMTFLKKGDGYGKIQINEVLYNLPLEIKLTKNKEYTLTALPNNTSLFNSWSGGITSLNNPYEFTPKQASTIYLDFQLKTYSISSGINPDGFGRVEGSGIYKYGSNATLKAIPYDNKNFVNWSIDNEIVGDSIEYSIDVIGDLEIMANFESAFWQITANTNPADAGQIIGTGYYSPNETAELIALTNDSWEFINWTENDEIISSDSILSFSVQSDRELTANFNFITDIKPDDYFIETKLYQPYPNPFNPATTFQFRLNNISEVSLVLYDLNGNVVDRIIDSKILNKGLFSKRYIADNLASGVYLYVFNAMDTFDKTFYSKKGKFILLK